MDKPSLKVDFYKNINYEWLQNNPIPSEYVKWSNFNVLNEINQERLKSMLEETPVTDDQIKLNILWTQGMNEEELNKSEPKKMINMFGEYDKFPIMDLMITFMKYNLCYLIDIGASADLKDSSRNVLYFDKTSLTLPDRDYYLLDSMEDKRTEYKSFLANFLPNFDIPGDGTDIFNFELEMAKVMLSRTDRRNPYNRYHDYTLEELKHVYSAIEWEKILETFNIKKDDKIIITEKAYFEFMNNYIEKCKNDNEEFIKLTNYFKYRFALTMAPYVDDVTYGLYFDFFGKKLMGQQEPKARWKRVVSTIDGQLGEILSKVYVEKYFSDEEKKACKDMVNEIIVTYRQRIQQLTWMNEETKQKALQKLDKMVVKIGYPDKWTDFSDVVINKKIYFNNLMNCYRWFINDNLKKCYQLVDKSEWHMNAHDINAYYSPSQNEIVFPAGILQAPFYSKDQTLAQNLGGIGSVIGHEMTHGFDDKGRLYDADGNLNDWWIASDAIQFEERSKKLEDLFNSYEFFGIKVNGKLTLGENIADLGGVTLALKTLERFDIMDQSKRDLFEQWAKVWRCNITDEALKNQLLTDPHSPTILRVNGILPNLEEFLRVYDISEWDKMYLKPELRSVIW
jgi:putative endopeptidase